MNDIRIATLRTIFAFGIGQDALSENPAIGVEALVRREKTLRDKGFTDTEAATILRASLTNPPGQRSQGHNDARRWAPWLCAYTGARIGEMVQLRAQDVFEEDGLWVMLITPEAGKQKTKKAWRVPIHDHLLEQGFVQFAKSKSGHLFFDVSKRRGSLNPTAQADSLSNKLAAWVRGLGIDDEAIQPNHAWRHYFKTLGRDRNMDASARAWIQGHAAANVGDSYGTWKAAALKRELDKIPRITIT